MKLKIYGGAKWLQLRVSIFVLYRMTTIDGIILVAPGADAIIGLTKGFIRQLASIPGLVIGLLTAKALYTPLTVKLCPVVADSMTVAQILAFVVIWVAVLLIFALVASVSIKVMEAASLGQLNRLLGARFGALKYLLLVSLAVCVT